MTAPSVPTVEFIIRSPSTIASILSATVGDDDVRHLRWLADNLGDDLLDAVVITTGAEAYRRSDGIAVIPAPCSVHECDR